MSSIPMPPDVDECQAHRDREARRAASGSSPEQLSLQDAYIEGSRAGGLGLSPSLNPFQDSVAEHGEWERGRRNALAQRMAGARR